MLIFQGVTGVYTLRIQDVLLRYPFQMGLDPLDNITGGKGWFGFLGISWIFEDKLNVSP